jgi:hypothetical protein
MFTLRADAGVSHALQLIVKAFVHVDLFGRHTHRNQILGDARHTLRDWSKYAALRAIHLDADHILG